jgi:hypothetical protein
MSLTGLAGAVSQWMWATDGRHHVKCGDRRRCRSAIRPSAPAGRGSGETTSSPRGRSTHPRPTRSAACVGTSCAGGDGSRPGPPPSPAGCRRRWKCRAPPFRQGRRRGGRECAIKNTDFRAATGTFDTSWRPGISAVQRPRRSSARRCAASCSVTLGSLDFDIAAGWMKNSQVVNATFSVPHATEG